MAPWRRKRRGEARLLLLVVSACWETAIGQTFDYATLRLQDIGNPANVILEVGKATVLEAPDFNMKVYAGARYAVRLANPTANAGIAAGSDPRFRLIFADASDCSSALDARYAAGAWSTVQGSVAAYAAAGEGFELSAADPLVFSMGGAYKLCFSEDGNFGAGGTTAIVPIKIKVKGVYDFVSSGLLSQRPYNCYLKKKAYYGYSTANGTYSATETSCRVWFGYSDVAAVNFMDPYEGDSGSWSAEFTLDPETRAVQAKGCGVAEPADFICNAPEVSGMGACSVGVRRIVPAVPNERTVRIPAVTNTLEGAAFRARAVAACYCPGYDSADADAGDCDGTSDFVQQIGLLHFYVSKVCRPGVAGCPEDYTGVTPQYRFKIAVQCPTDACRAESSTRMKLVSQNANNDLPSWMSNSGCRTAEHGKIQLSPTQSRMALSASSFAPLGVYQPFAPPVTPLTTNPTTCQSTTGCPQSGFGVTPALGGYEEQDYKEFGGTSGFQFVMGNTNHEARNFYSSYKLDVCYCNRDCDTMTNWFKAGAMRLSPTRLVSSATAQSNLPAQWALEYVKQPGIVGTYRSYDDEYTLGLQENGMLIKIVRDMPEAGAQPAQGDYKCVKSGYDSQLVFGPSDQGAASFNYAGTTTPPESERVVYNAGFVARTITINTAGRVAVCYCGLVDDSGLCRDGGDLSVNWRLLTHMTIKGPRLLPQQRWQFSTNVTFRFSYLGYGLSSYDKLRIIDFSGKCDDDNFSPNRAAFEYTFLRVGCPVTCEKVTLNVGSRPGDLSTRVRSADCASFDRSNSGCLVNDIKEVTVVSSSETELLFQQPHGFEDGDEVTLGDNILCNPADLTCTPEALNALKGVYSFQDTDNNDYQAPSTYMTAHKVATVPGDPRRARIQLGWPSPRPRFVVVFVGADPNNPLIVGRGGQWTHHTQGFTQEEVMGEKPRANLKVCWSYGRPESPGAVKYVEEVGLLTVTDPAVMEGATLSLSTTKLNQPAPMVLQFRTASSAQVGLKYDMAQDSLRLKIIFTYPKLLDIHKSGIDAEVIPYTEFVSYEQASQQACGKIFLELWSEDMEHGFPLPRGCYYRSFGGATPRREMEMVFEKKNGLRKNTIYQIVFNGHIQDVLEPVTYTLKQNTFMQVIPMDDVTDRPYEAIERGDVILHPSGPIPKRDATEASPKFSAVSGFKILGGYNNLLELRSGDTLVVELMGGDGQGERIGAGCRVRIFLWPFTQWQTTSSCTAGCIVGGEASFLCTSIKCEAEPVVPGMTLNILKLTLGELTDKWKGFGDLYGSKKARIRIGAVTMPAGGFFAERLAAQVTDAGMSASIDSLDNFPDYFQSVGAFIWKAPNEGQTVAKVVSRAGGGNTQPFREEVDNILYARLMLSSTLMARDDSGQDASFTITLPRGYTCKQPPAGTTNYWEAPDDLPAFGDEVPQGRGTPDDGTVAHGWSASGNTCTFKPMHPYGIIYSGSSMTVRIIADNPDTALPRSSPENLWTMTASARGLCGTTLCAKQGEDRVYKFLSSPDPNYESNSVVLGRISRSSMQPTNFALRGVRDKAQDVRVFFQTEQEVIGGGEILVEAPPGFGFGSPCVAMDLEAPYYAVGGDPATATLRLPVDRSTATFPCTTEYLTDSGSGLGYQRARVRLRDILQGGRYFGFQVRVENPAEQAVYAQDGWRIYTADSAGFLVDGTPSAVPFLDSDGNSWSVYASNTTGFRAFLKVEAQPGLIIGGATVLDMRPYEMTSRSVYVMLEMQNVPQGDSGQIRVTAPDGYKWDFSGQQLIFRDRGDPLLDASLQAKAPPGITAPFPPCVVANSAATSCPVTRVSDTILAFPDAYFSSRETYGFAVPVRIPAQNPTTSSHAFFLELGYTSASVSQRKAAAQIPVPDVRALRNAVVDYTTSIKGKETALQFYLETVTDIPLGGFIQIVAPLGFNFSDDCYLMRVTDPGAPAAPPLACKHTLTMLGPRVRLRAEREILKGGSQAFAILAENPRQTVHNYPTGATPCGTDICWSFKTFRDTVAGEEELDYGTSAQGYSINDKMLEARIPPLTSLQNYATGRDDRPMQRNNVIFAFQLSGDAARTGELRLRGPQGFVFDEECTPGIEVSAERMFGVGNRFPDEFTVWPAGVTVQSCRGYGPNARLNLTIATGSMLRGSRLYIFRVGNFTNPLTTPDPNRWTVELSSGFAGEASEPIEGMQLWAFTQTRVTPIATARDQTLAGEVRTRNPLRISFRPHNTVPSEGQLRAAAPDGFQFVHLPSRECEVQLQELPYTELGVNYPGYVWPQAMLVCLADEGDSSKLKVRLRDPRPITKGLEYELILIVYNSRVGSTYPADWILQSYLPGDLALDESRMLGFTVNNVMDFKYSNPDPSSSGQEVRNGKARLPAFTLKMQFPEELQVGDKIVIIVPTEFIFTDANWRDGRCLNFRPVCLQENLAPGRDCVLPLSAPPVCNATDSTITFSVIENPPIPQETLIMFGIDFINPARTMDVKDNFWRCTHYGPPVATLLKRGFRFREGADYNLPIKSSKAFESWAIIPQMEQVSVDIIQPGNLAAGSVSAITVTFRAVNDAEDVAIEVVQPQGFDFGAATLEPAVPPQEIMRPDTAGSLVRVRTSVTTGQVITIVLRGVQLGQGGGQTLVRLTSWSGGLLQNGVWKPGTKQDERLDCAELCSFGLPGLVDISYEKLENQYHQNPGTYPVQSRWEAQMGRPAMIQFRFHFTQGVKVGQELWIHGKPYEPTISKFSLTEAAPASLVAAEADDPAARAVSTRIKDVLDKTLKVVMVQTLVPYQEYEVAFSVIAPTPEAVEAHVGPIHWSVESWAVPYGDLPTNTNDGKTREFPIVEEYIFRVEAPRAPPTAEIEVSLFVKPGLKAPTALIVVVPLMFSISNDCLAYGGDQVVSCSPSTPMPDGRMTAKLICNEPGLTAAASGVRIKVRTPAKEPLAKAWFVEGRDEWTDAQYGWGEATGIDIDQMSETSVAYPGIPGVKARMVWRFRSQVLVEAGGWLHVMLPEGFAPDCAPPNLEGIALPATGGCSIPDPENVLIYLNSTIVPGEYAFAFYVTPPSMTPIRNQLSLILKDAAGRVQDAAVDLAGMTVQEKLKIKELPLRWTSAKALRSSVITMGFEALEPLPDLVVAPEQQVGEILITLPEGFTHLVSEPSEFTLMNEDMPLKGSIKAGEWLDYMQKDRLRVILNLNRTSWMTLKTGRFDFQFPVRVPSPLPVFNVWHLCLCSPSFPGGCNRITDPSVLLTFPMPGFRLGQSYGASAGALNLGLTSQAGGLARAPGCRAPLLWLLAAALVVARSVAVGPWPGG